MFHSLGYDLALLGTVLPLSLHGRRAQSVLAPRLFIVRPTGVPRSGPRGPASPSSRTGGGNGRRRINLPPITCEHVVGDRRERGARPILLCSGGVFAEKGQALVTGRPAGLS